MYLLLHSLSLDVLDLANLGGIFFLAFWIREDALHSFPKYSTISITYSLSVGRSQSWLPMKNTWKTWKNKQTNIFWTYPRPIKSPRVRPRQLHFLNSLSGTDVHVLKVKCLHQRKSNKGQLPISKFQQTVLCYPVLSSQMKPWTFWTEFHKAR